MVSLVAAVLMLSGASPGAGSPWEELQSPDVAVRSRAYSTLAGAAYAQHKEYTERCIALLEDADTENVAQIENPPAALAIRLLGLTRDERAVPVLVRFINYNVQEEVLERTRFDGKPGAAALAQIGFPAVRYILSNNKVLAGADDEALRRFALIICDVFPDRKSARAFMEAYDPGYDAAARAKHAELVKLVAKYP